MIYFDPPNTDIDWPQLINDLRQTGMNMDCIAHHIGCKRDFTNQLWRGHAKSCQYRIGANLIELHRQRCVDTLEAAE